MKKLIGLKSLLLLISLMFFQVHSTLAQDKYFAYNAGVKSSIFSEGFDDNSNQWLTDNLWISGKMISGYYYLICKNYQKSTGLSYKTIPIPVMLTMKSRPP